MALVLLVDDDQDNREMYAMFLARRGLEVIEAGDGRSALELAYAKQPSLVVMDLTLPDMDGLRVIHQLQGDPRTRATPIIVVSGYSDPGDVGGAKPPWSAFLVKPCAPEKLVETIRRLLPSG